MSTQPAIIKLKLGTSLQAPNTRFRADLVDVTNAVNRMRNRMLRAWQRWHEDNPDWQPGAVVDEYGTPKLKKDGEPLLQSRIFPSCQRYESRLLVLHAIRAGAKTVQAIGDATGMSTKAINGVLAGTLGKDKTPDPWFDGCTLTAEGKKVKAPRPDVHEAGIKAMSTFLYQAGTSAEPLISSTFAMMASGEVDGWLGAKMPYTHRGPERFRWEAVLSGAINPASFREMMIPLHNQSLVISYDGDNTPAFEKRLPRSVKALVEQFGRVGAVLAFPLWSQQSDREDNWAVARINVGTLMPGYRLILRQIARGQLGLSDSKLVEKEGEWYLHLCYKRVSKELGLDVSRTATLAPNTPTQTNPFRITEPSGKAWQLGHGNLVKRTFARLDARRREMRTDYTVSGHGRRGHGRQRNERDIRPITRRVNHLLNDMASSIVEELIRFCVRWDCGRILYAEPFVGSRQRYTWYGGQNVQWDWTLFLGKLKHQAWVHGIELVVEQAKVGEGEGDEPNTGNRSRGGKTATT